MLRATYTELRCSDWSRAGQMDLPCSTARAEQGLLQHKDRMMGVALSVVIPTKDSEAVLAQCLGSLVAQQFRGFEVLVMDGCSKDTTLAIAESYRRELPVLRVLSGADGGIYEAMNRGLALASGQFVMFLGSDDAIHGPTVFEELFAGRHRRLVQRRDVVYGDVETVPDCQILRQQLSYGGFAKRNLCHQSIVYRTTALRSVGGFEVTYRASADWLANVRLFCTPCVRFAHVPLLVCRFQLGGFHARYVEPPVFYTERDAVLRKFLSCDRLAKLRCLRWWQVQRRYGALSGRAWGLLGLLRRLAGVVFRRGATGTGRDKDTQQRDM